MEKSVLLTGEDLRLARRSLALLSRRFLTLRLSSIRDPSLADGHAGLALVHAALDGAFPDRGHAALAERALARALGALATKPLRPGLYSGFPGVTWVAELLTGDPEAPASEDPLTPIDAALEAHLARTGERWRAPYDLVEGLVGIAVYGLERMPRVTAKRLLALVVRRLRETARPQGPGVTWWSDPEWTPERWRPNPHPDYNLGVAHGVPGVIAVLARIAASDVDGRTKRSARRLLDGAVAWLLGQELPASSPSCFASATCESSPARAAWCYGDPGIAATLLVAARAVGERDWERVAVRIALRAAARPEGDCGVDDAGLCHGAAGLAVIFQRMHRTTGDARLAAAARRWFARTLAMRRSRGGFAGFAAWMPDARGKSSWQASSAFLMGAGGVALALVAATTDAEPSWDRALLLS